MFFFLELNIREQKKYEKRMQTSVDNTVNDLCYEIKFENRVKVKNNFFIKRNIAFLFQTKYILFLERYLLKIPKNLIASVFLFFVLVRLILKNTDLPRQKVRMLHWLNHQK